MLDGNPFSAGDLALYPSDAPNGLPHIDCLTTEGSVWQWGRSLIEREETAYFRQSSTEQILSCFGFFASNPTAVAFTFARSLQRAGNGHIVG